jgi:hypothetical protein
MLSDKSLSATQLMDYRRELLGLQVQVPTPHRLRQRYGRCNAGQTKPDQTTAGKRASNFKRLLIAIIIINIIIVNREKVTDQLPSTNSLVAPRDP